MTISSAGYLRKIAENARGITSPEALAAVKNMLADDLDQAANLIDAYAREVASLRGYAAGWRRRARRLQARDDGGWQRRYVDLAEECSELHREVNRLRGAKDKAVTLILALSRMATTSEPALLAAAEN